MRATVFASLILSAALWTGCKDKAAEVEPVRPVRAVKVGDLQAIQARAFPGRAKAKEEVVLSFQVAGPLVSLPVDVGSDVKRGDLIAAIDPRDFLAAVENNQGTLDRARANLLAMQRGARPEEIEQLKAIVEQAQASYEQALAEHERNTQLAEQGAVTQAEFDISQARAKRTEAEVKKAKEDLNIGMNGARQEDIEAKQAEIRALEAAVDAAKNQLEYTRLTAPFAGRVSARYVDNFQTVQAKQQIVRLLDVSRIEIIVQVPESLIALVPQVKEVTCVFDAIAGREFVGQVTKIGSEASQITRTYPVTVEIEPPQDAQILPGMAATVRNRPEILAGESTPAPLLVPSSALFTGEGGPKTYLWVVDDAGKSVTKRAVKTGALTPVGITIAEGLKAGEWVVMSGVHSLREGQEVKLLEERSP